MIIIAHRGGAGDNLGLENSRRAIKAVLECGIDEIEIDVRVAPGKISGIPVLKHDPLLPSDKGLATLESIIELVNKRVPLYIEVKPREPLEQVIGVLAHYLEKGWKPEHFLLGSKSQPLLRELHTVFPQIEMIVIESWSSVRAVYHARQVGTKRLSMNKLWLWSGVIRGLTKRGYKLAAYTMDDPAKLAHWERAGLYAVITNYPERFLK
jgi:glycerophosphoryl diester phosphodiesterase